MNVTLNPEKNGIEVKFDTKPDASILDGLKANGFRWSGKQKIWYAKQTAERMAWINGIGEITEAIPETIIPHTIYDLWRMTRTDGIEDNFEKYHIYDTKEIAAIIRKHIKDRFPMCKWSVTKDRNSIDVSMLASPYPIDSEEIKAIVNYVYDFAQSYNYDDSDYYSDYHDVNFYGVYKDEIVRDYRYEQREATENEKAISEKFKTAKAAFDKAEEERKAREIEESIRQAEIRQKEAEIKVAQEKVIHDKIESSFTEKAVDYFAMQVLSPTINKNCTVAEILECDDFTRENCKVSKEIHFDKETYELFADRLLDDYSFLEGMGGTATDDLRVQTMQDYHRMTEEERKTVEWYNVNCVAIYCDGELKLVVDPQGYSYARYTFIFDNESKVIKQYKGKSEISEDEYQCNLEAAEMIEDASAEIIIENNLKDTWDNAKFGLYRSLMTKWILTNGKFKFNSGVVRAITNENLKTAMYRLLTEPEEITEQFKQADLTAGQKITVVRIGEIGGIIDSKITVESVEYGKYAQYDKAVKLIFKQQAKRGMYYQWYYRDMLVFNGWIDIPESLLCEEIPSNTAMFTTRKTKFLSCDNAQYDVILDYFEAQGIKPIINTYKPRF